MITVTVAWVMFRAADITEGLRYIGSMFGIGTTGFFDSGVMVTLRGTGGVFLLACLSATPIYRKIIGKVKTKRTKRTFENIWLTGIGLLSVLKVIGSSYNPFIYFNF